MGGFRAGAGAKTGHAARVPVRRLFAGTVWISRSARGSAASDRKIMKTATRGRWAGPRPRWGRQAARSPRAGPSLPSFDGGCPDFRLGYGSVRVSGSKTVETATRGKRGGFRAGARSGKTGQAARHPFCWRCSDSPVCARIGAGVRSKIMKTATRGRGAGAAPACGSTGRLAPRPFISLDGLFCSSAGARSSVSPRPPECPPGPIPPLRMVLARVWAALGSITVARADPSLPHDRLPISLSLQMVVIANRPFIVDMG